MSGAESEYQTLNPLGEMMEEGLTFVRDGRVYVIQNKGTQKEHIMIVPTEDADECKLFLQHLSPGFAMCLRAAGVLTDLAPYSTFWRVWPRVMDVVSMYSLVGWLLMVLLIVSGHEHQFPGWVWGWREITIERDLTAVVGIMFTLQAPICLYFGRRYFSSKGRNLFGCLASHVYHMCHTTFQHQTRRAIWVTVAWPVLCTVITMGTLGPLYSQRDVPAVEIAGDCFVFGTVLFLFMVIFTGMAASFSLVTSLHRVQLVHCTNMLRRYTEGNREDSLFDIVQYHMGVRRCLGASIRALQTYFGLVTGLTFLGLLMQLWIFLDSSDSSRGVRFMFAAFFSVPPIVGMINAAQVSQAAKTLFLAVSLLPVDVQEPGAQDTEAGKESLHTVTFAHGYFTSWTLTGNLGFSVLGVPITPSVLARAAYGLLTAALLIIQSKR